MDLQRIDTQRTYRELLELITTLALPPGEPLNEQLLAGRLNTTVTAVQEALKLLAHDGLVTVTARHGIYVAEANAADLAELSELRLELEGLAARLAAQRATADDLAVLDALCREQEAFARDEPQRLFDLDHRFHQAIAAAAHNRYLAKTLEQFFGLSRRLWFLALPRLGSLPGAVGVHVALVEAIRARDADRAERLMHAHVEGFYAEARAALEEDRS
ncbi:MAG: GntR family transcriptional regulator [Chloroflexi bacterium]|jgi:DNA-binding GntR family transcriptional regulator|nr:GntR family transcriptional regulator [Chloroflexota bacterium]